MWEGSHEGHTERPTEGIRATESKGEEQLVILIALVGFLSVLTALRTDVVRLGPSSVALPADALMLSVTWYRFPDIDPTHDYCMFVVHVANRLSSDSIMPYDIDVNVSTVQGENGGIWLPKGGDHTDTEVISQVWGGAPPAVTLVLPAGYVSRHRTVFRVSMNRDMDFTRSGSAST